MQASKDQCSNQRTSVDIALAIIALITIFVHDVSHIQAGKWPNIFYLCDIAAFLVGPALFFQNATLTTICFIWLMFGSSVWLLDSTINAIPTQFTSWLIHIGSFSIAAYGVRRFGVGQKSLHGAILLLLFSVAFSRLFLPPEANINVAHFVPNGWGFLGTNQWVFLVNCLLLATVVALIGHRLACFIARTPLLAVVEKSANDNHASSSHQSK